MWDENRAEGSLFDFLFITLKNLLHGEEKVHEETPRDAVSELQSPQVTILSNAAEEKNVAPSSTLARCEPVTHHLLPGAACAKAGSDLVLSAWRGWTSGSAAGSGEAGSCG